MHLLTNGGESFPAETARKLPKIDSPYQGENRRGGSAVSARSADYAIAESASVRTFDNRRLCERG